MSIHYIQGTNQADTLTGTEADDHIYGRGGDDLLETSNTGGEHDILHGGAGDDTISGGRGRAYGGSGNDTVLWSHLAFGGVGDDIVSGRYAFGGTGNDTVSTSSNGAAYGGLGDDHVNGGYRSLLFGGDGQDVLSVTSWENTLTGGAQADVFHFVLEYDTYTDEFSMRNNVITDFQSGVDKIQLGMLRGLEFNERGDTVRYADQEDGFLWEEITLTAEGNDTRLSANAYLLSGDSYYIDVLIRNVAPGDLSQDDFIFHAPIATEIQGTQQSDELYGTRGNDTLSGFAGDDRLIGDAGDDVLFGGNGSDRMRAYNGADYLSGGDGADYLSGGDGADILSGGAGWDELRGGSGADTFVFDSSTAWRERVQDFEVGTDIIRLNGTDATSFGDLTFANRTLDLGYGDVDGVIVNYGNGSAFLRGVTKAEIANSSNFVFGNDPAPASLSPPDQSEQQESPPLVGTEEDCLLCDKSSDRLYGDDRLFGEAQSDTLFGGPGNDMLAGREGWDIMIGGLGADTFVFDASNAWRERVLDFETGTDMICFNGTNASQFSDLRIRHITLEEGDGVLVNYGNGSVFLLDTTLDAINDAANFEFV